MEWIHFPRIRTFVEKRFHGLFSKKKRSKCGGVPSFESFPRREHSSGINFPPDWAANSSRSISRHYWMTLKFSRVTARETCSRAVISLQKNLSRKISRFFVSKISPATGVTDTTKTDFLDILVRTNLLVLTWFFCKCLNRQSSAHTPLKLLVISLAQKSWVNSTIQKSMADPL